MLVACANTSEMLEVIATSSVDGIVWAEIDTIDTGIGSHVTSI